MNKPSSRAGQAMQTQSASVESTPWAGRAVIHVYLGVRFKVEALPRGRLFQGRFTLLGDGRPRENGSDDSRRPTAQNAWATKAEALAHATEAAHHAIEGMAPHTAGEPSGG